MTACTNHGGKARRVVTAALVGVLSVGTVPMAALATGVSDGIQTLAADWTAGAKVTSATDGQGNQLTGDLSKQTFTKGSGKFLVPTHIEGDFGSVEVTEDMLQYYSDSARTPSSYEVFSNWVKDNATADTYYVRVTYKNVNKDFAFKIVDENKYDGAYIFYGDDATDKEIVYGGGQSWDTYDVHVADADGNQIDSSVASWGKLYNDKGDVLFDPATPSNVPMMNAGNYVVEVTFVGETSPRMIPFTVSELDLSENPLSFSDTATAPSSASSFLSGLVYNGSTIAGILADDLAVTKISSPNGGSSFSGGYGEYSVTIGATQNNKNVTGETTVSFTVYEKNIFDQGKVFYDGDDATSGVTVRLDKGESFDASDVTVEWGDQTFSGDQLELSFTKGGKAVDVSKLAEAGKYEMTVRVKPFEDFTEGIIGGSTKVSINVTGNTVDAKDELAFYLDGELAGAADSVTYDGTDQLDRLSVSIKKGDRTFVEGTDYELEVKNLDTNKAVDQAVDAGTYQVTVKPLTFTLDNSGDAVFTLTVNKAKIALSDAAGESLKDLLYTADNPATTTVDEYVNDAIGYTGSALEVPGVQYPVLSADGSVKKVDGKVVYAALDPSLYNVVTIRNGEQKSVSEMKDADTYTVRIALTDEAAKNYQLNDQDFEVQVKEYSPFADVESPAWYASVVETAKHNGYVNGMSGTNLFAPETDITRADAVCIIFNMAGGENWNGMGDYQYSETTGWMTGFDDVDGHAYYAKALAWAHAAGVANGSNGSFRPTDEITREEFAALLANFARSKGDYVTPSEGALDGVSDASTVSGWATEVVAWAVENGVMGNGGFVNAGANILRAEVAAMAVNYQPEKL